jgi:hypothetical protein
VACGDIILSITVAIIVYITFNLLKLSIYIYTRFDADDYTVTDEGISALNTMDCEIENYLPVSLFTWNLS